MKKIAYTGFALLLVTSIELYSQTLQWSDGDVIVVLGNSITELGEKPDGYVNILRKTMAVMYPQMRVYFVNSGYSGHKSTEMEARFQSDVVELEPDWVIISVGVNDVWHGFLAVERNRPDLSSVPLPTFKEKVTLMVQRAQAKNIKVAIMTTTVIKENLSSPENKALEPYNQALREIAKRYHCLLIDQNAAFRKAIESAKKDSLADRGFLTYDGVHLSAAGNRLMAQTILKTFGVSLSQWEIAQPLIQAEIEKDRQLLEKNAERYFETNHEVGQPCNGQKRIVFYGSSSVDMWNLAKAFPDVPFYNRGIGGENSRQMCLRFQQDVAQLKPTAVILFLGSCNDFWPDVRMSRQETKANLMRMARMTEKLGAKLAIGAIMPVNDYLPGKDFVSSHPIAKVQQLNRWIKSFCEQNGYAFIDFYSAVADENGKLEASFTDDGMHCNPRGYEQWQPLVQKVLEEWGFGIPIRNHIKNNGINIPKPFAGLIGNWQGSKQLQIHPDAPIQKSKSTAIVQAEAMGKFIGIRYTWRYQNKDQQGLLLIGYENDHQRASAVWIDSWHMQDKAMLCTGQFSDANTLTLNGSYAAGQGPDWGWKISIKVKNANAFDLIMYNIPPEHGEVQAVKIEYTRL